MSSTPRVTAPIIEPGSKVKGPASYFSSITTTYGQPIREWLDLVTPQWTAGSSHMEIVTTSTDEHGMVHGHANACAHHSTGDVIGRQGICSYGGDRRSPVRASRSDHRHKG